MSTYKYKVIIVGDFGVGKTSLINTFMEERFRENYIPTLGVQFNKKSIEIDGSSVDLIIWDIAGQDSFQDIRSKFYAKTEGLIIVYDITRKSSLENVKNWYEDVFKQIGKVPCILIGNKADLKEKREINDEDTKNMLWKNKIDLNYRFETSAKTGENVEEGFYCLAKLMMKKK